MFSLKGKYLEKTWTNPSELLLQLSEVSLCSSQQFLSATYLHGTSETPPGNSGKQ